MATISFVMDILVFRLYEGKQGGFTWRLGVHQGQGGGLFWQGGPSPLPMLPPQPTGGFTKSSVTSWCSSTSRGPCTQWH